MMLILLIFLGTPLSTFGHGVLGRFVRSRTQISAGARNLDVKVELTFFEEWSARERAQMDADGDGRLSSAESTAYVKLQEHALAEALALTVDGQKVNLALLNTPELDLLSDHNVGPAHHRLVLVYFAASPVQLRAGSQLVIEERLWPGAPALRSLEVSGTDGYRLGPGAASDAIVEPLKDGQSRSCRATCLEAPENHKLQP
jgi:hypothetical protein